MPKHKKLTGVAISINVMLCSTIFLPAAKAALSVIESNETAVYQDVITLVEWGYIEAATTTFPLPWKGIKQQLAQLDIALLPASAALAVNRLQRFIDSQQQSAQPRSLSFYAANDTERFSTLATQHREQDRFNLRQQADWGGWSGQLSISQASGGKTHFDQSYLSYTFDNWSLRVGAIDQWWGPAQSSSLILSNNARPIPTIALSRAQATPSKNTWLSFLGPWYFTAQLGQLESKRAIPDAKLWLSRFTFKPLAGLEFGASWTAMWGGQGQGNGFRDLFDVLTFKAQCADGSAHCDDALDTKKGNHLAGFDIKYSFVAFDRPINLYAQRIGEDAVDYYKVTDQALLFGLSTYIGSSKIYLESSDTNVACGAKGSSTRNCYYEHGDYQSGYRFYGRAIGSTFDSDAKMLSVGLNHHFDNGDTVELLIRHLNLNEDQQHPSPVVEGLSEKLIQLSGFYQTTLGNWQLKVGGQITRSEIDHQPKQSKHLIYSELTYHLN